MGGAAFDLAPYLTTGLTVAVDGVTYFKTFTLTDVPVTGDLVLDLLGSAVNRYLFSPSVENGTVPAPGASGGAVFRVPGGSCRLTFTPDAGYGLNPPEGVTESTYISQPWNYSYMTFTDANTGEALDFSTLYKGRNTLSHNENGNYYLQLAALPSKDITYHIAFEKLEEVAPTVYAVALDLAHVTISNTATQATEGTPYTATLTAEDGYDLASITVKMGGVDITASAVSGNAVSIPSVTGDIVITAVATEIAQPETNSYTVTKEEGATYGFTLGDDGWYINDNKGVHSSAALARINLHMATAGTVMIQCINYAEPSWDYGFVSHLDTALSLDWAMANSNTDGARKAFNLAGDSSTAIITLDYEVPAGEHFIVCKYKKDGSGNTNGDYFKFKVVM